MDITTVTSSWSLQMDAGIFERWVAREGMVSLAAAQGLTYRIVVMSYRPPEALELRAEVR